MILTSGLIGYENFSSAVEVWDKLDERYQVPKNAPESEQVRRLSFIFFFASDSADYICTGAVRQDARR